MKAFLFATLIYNFLIVIISFLFFKFAMYFWLKNYSFAFSYHLLFALAQKSQLQLGLIDDSFAPFGIKITLQATYFLLSHLIIHRLAFYVSYQRFITNFSFRLKNHIDDFVFDFLAPEFFSLSPTIFEFYSIFIFLIKIFEI